jgi:hypothetical protein
MEPMQRAIYVFVLIFGTVGALPFLLSILYRTLKRGIIERRHPLRPFTRGETPRAYWGTVAFMALGPVLLGWGMGVMFYRLLHS